MRAAQSAITNTLLADLKCCSLRRDLRWGRRIHANAIASGIVSSTYLVSALIKMYAKCGSIGEARRVFDNVHKPTVVSWTALLLGYAENGEGYVALNLFSRMKACGCEPTSVTYIAAVKACTALVHGDASSKRACLEQGRQIHSQIVQRDPYVQSALIDMYAKCGSMEDARLVFNSIQNPDAVSWNTLLLGYAEAGQAHVVLDLYSRMKTMGKCSPTSVTYIAALKACSLAEGNETALYLERGKEIHAEVGCYSDRYVQNTLIDMYAKLGSMAEARRVFDNIQNPNVVSWTSLLLGYAENGEGKTALDLFTRMKSTGCEPNSVTHVAALKACASLAASEDSNGHYLECGRKIHLEIGCANHYVQSTLIDMYAKFGCMSEARQVFDDIPNPDVVTWNALVSGYAENGEGPVALDLFSRMIARGCSCTSVTYIAAIKACTSLLISGQGNKKEDYLERGRKIHAEIRCQPDCYLQNALIDMYAKYGSMVEAQGVFDSMKNPNVVSWNALLMGYAENGEGYVALDVFSKMKATSGYRPTSVTYIAALKACSSLAVSGRKQDCLQWGREIHSEVERFSDLDLYVQNTLIDMYAKARSMGEAQRAFDSIQNPNVVSWTALLLGYADNGKGYVALDLYSKMKARGYVPSCVTYGAALKACISLAVNGDLHEKQVSLERGKMIHSEIACELDQYMQSTLIDMYAKCGSMVEARSVFDSIQHPDVVSWNALLRGYADNGEEHMTLDLFSRMKAVGCVPSSVTYIAVLKACSSVGDLAFGRRFHSEIRDFDAHVVASLVTFYAKCGSIVEAREVFDLHRGARDVSTWTALLTGYASFGDTTSMFDLFEAMQDAGFRPDAVTLVCMLLCCSHAGLVEKAREHFEAMAVRYGVTPTAVHYTCMVDVLGRANQMNEAIQVIREMPVKPQAMAWSSLLSACRKWRNVETGRLAFQSWVGMDKEDTSAHVLMAHIYGGNLLAMTGTSGHETAACEDIKAGDLSEQVSNANWPG